MVYGGGKCHCSFGESVEHYYFLVPRPVGGRDSTAISKLQVTRSTLACGSNERVQLKRASPVDLVAGAALQEAEAVNMIGVMGSSGGTSFDRSSFDGKHRWLIA